MSIYEQLAQQLDPYSIASEKPATSLLGWLAKPSGKPEIPQLLGFTKACEQGQPQGLLGQLMKEELGNG